MRNEILKINFFLNIICFYLKNVNKTKSQNKENFFEVFKKKKKKKF